MNIHSGRLNKVPMTSFGSDSCRFMRLRTEAMDRQFLILVFMLAKSIFATDVLSRGDVIILLDSSDNARSKNFEIEIKFAVQLAKSIYSRENRIGLFTFGDNTHDQFQLNSYNDEQQIVQAIKYMWYSTGNGAVDAAINFTLSNGFQQAKGDRECVPNIFVILTHSAITDLSTAKELRTALTQKSVQTFVLNMANASATAHFATMTNSLSRVLNINDFAALENSVTGLVQKISSDLPSTGCGILTQWLPWTPCSATCGPGLKYRLRECKKVLETDKDCDADLSEDYGCYADPCTDPVDGHWANWNNWGPCSKSCDFGTQRRTRQCTEPSPEHNGKPCPGMNQQIRNCSEWSCPVRDCGKKCPQGGRISQDCEQCICLHATLFGKITDETGLPVENADIYLQSRRYKPVARSDDFGIFSVTDQCLMNEQIFISALLHESKLQTPSSVNSTHWTINGIIEKYIPAVFTVQPEDKIRMVGQSYSLCCSAVGKPQPTTYSWYKDDIELEHQGTNGTLTIASAQKSDSGAYKCSTETLAGVSQSDESEVTVSDLAQDTCSAPTTKLEQLPAGCYLTGDSTKRGSVDVGTCGQTKCMSTSLKDNATCTDWWPHYCCDSKDIENIEITCDGFSYQISRVKSCQCQLCIFRTSISGRAVGRNNSKNIPFKLGDIYINGKKVARTNMVGFFKFTVPTGTKRVVATFQDTFFKKFMDITKIIDISDGEDVFATIVIPLKPNPIPFNTSHPAAIELGGGKDGLSSAASLSIEKDSFVDANGDVFKGSAKATVHFMDPRDRDSLDEANGEFVSESAAGEKLPLRTFGMFQLGVHDDKGNPLNVKKPIKFYLDSSLFNISIDKNGDPDLAMWDYDTNKGIWVENAKLRFSTSTVGGRKLLASPSTVFAEFRPQNIPKLEEYKKQTTHTVQRWTGGYTNCDHSVKTYEYVQVKDPKELKQGVIYVGVSVFSDMTLTKPHSTSTQSVTIHAYTREIYGARSYLGKKEVRRLTNGHACLMVFQNQEVYLNVESEGEWLTPALHTLPNPYPVKQPANKTVRFESRFFGSAYRGQPLCKKPPCSGPLYLYKDRSTCEAARNDNSYHFNFAFFTRPSSIQYIEGSGNVYDKRLSWYPVSPDKGTYRACYIKLSVKIYETYDIRIVATSRLGSLAGDQFGTHEVGPIPNAGSKNFTNRGACMEFRCPGYIKDGSKEMFDIDTAVNIMLQTTNSSLNCKMSVRNNKLTPDITAINKGTRGDVGLTFLAKHGRNYGSSYGVYINDAHQKDVEKFCRNGQDSGSHFDGFMYPDKNYAVEFNCLH